MAEPDNTQEMDAEKRLKDLEQQVEELQDQFLAGVNRREALQVGGVLGLGALLGGGGVYTAANQANGEASRLDLDSDIGTPSDRVDVFADGLDSFSVITGKVLTNAINSEPGFISGLLTSYVDASTVSVAPGVAIADDDKTVINVASTLSADVSTTGLGGRQSGLVEQANSWYEIKVIADTDGSNPSAFLVEESQMFNNPKSVSRRIGWVRNDGSSNFCQFYHNNPIQWEWHDHTRHEALDTSSPPTSYTPLSLSNHIPPTATDVRLRLFSTGDGTADIHHLDVKDPKVSKDFNGTAVGYAGHSVSDAQTTVWCPVDDAQNIDYRTARSSRALIRVIGWREYR